MARLDGGDYRAFSRFTDLLGAVAFISNTFQYLTFFTIRRGIICTDISFASVNWTATFPETNLLMMTFITFFLFRRLTLIWLTFRII